MNVKRIAVWALLFVCLAVYVALFESELPPKKRAAEEKLVKVFTFSPRDIRQLEIIKNNKKVTVTRTGTAWQCRYPSPGNVPQESIESLLSALADLVNVGDIAEGSADLQQFGLEKPEMHITLFLEKQAAPVTLLLGSDTPTGISLYAMIQGSHQVIQVGNLIRFSVNSFFASYSTAKVYREGK